MAQATAHPDRRLISSEDVQGTDVYGIGDEAIGQIDHLLIEKISGRVAYAVMSFGGFLGIGSDFFGGPQAEGLKDVACFPGIFAELMRRGWPDADLEKLASGNFVRVFEGVEKARAPAR